MNNTNTTIPLAVLLLNDLLNTHVIDIDMYNKALAKLTTIEMDKQAA